MNRSVVKPPDIVKFDEMISPHEVKALQERFSDSDSGSDIFNYDMEMEGWRHNYNNYITVNTHTE